MTRRRAGIPAAVGFVAMILAANYLTTRFGFVPVGFGLVATAGTYAAGFALALRDLVHDTLGRWAVLGVIVAGAGLSLAIAAPAIAVASGVAFLLSELVDMAVYAPLRRRRWALAVIVSNLAGALVDTVIFLGIAFGAAAIAPALPGQLVGKMWATVAYVGVGWVIARAVLRQSHHADSA